MSARERLDALLASRHVNAPTRQVLEERLGATFERTFFSPEEFRVLRAVTRRLVPHDPAEVDLAGCLDDRLSGGRTDGWRYDDSPPDEEAVRLLLAALPADFAERSVEAQDEWLRGVERQFPHPFEDLLAELTEAYYSHPLTQVRIGYIGFADAPGWKQIGLNEREPREAATEETLADF